WNEEWEKNLQVIKVTDRIVIKPSSKSYIPNKKEIILTIDPKMSFGTGEHQTTKLMLRLIEKCVRPGMKVLDIGSGTAVLAIAAVKLGAANAIAIDNDEICFENGNENISLNNVEDKVEIKIGELKEIKENNFDLIVANIQKNILLNISYDIGNRLNKNGLVILSGLLAEDEEDILSRYKETGLYFIEKEKMDEWIALVFCLK
ncbi:MAG TPA: 50S ribosomal protein L11 methyltransferase, partial [Ignavibacteriaceae bacterium]|nr:50S ribosomal protein L11 methyltransferase [Ignavibacteriaceae bacterium]